MSKRRIGISGWGSTSPLGREKEAIWSAYLQKDSLIKKDDKLDAFVASLPITNESKVDSLLAHHPKYKAVDRSVHLAILASEQAIQQANWRGEKSFGVNLGSSRGATASFEQFYQDFQSGHPSPLSSPYTTLGNISALTARHVKADGPIISHSVTCSTSAQAILNGMNWLESGRCQRFLVGGSEAPLTNFTIAQMQALRIYAGNTPSTYPCLALDQSKTQNTMVLGEGSASFALEVNPKEPLAWISGIGYALDPAETSTGITQAGIGFQRSMQMACQEAGNPEIDLVLCHSPGTLKGDAAERNAIETIFTKNIPFLTTNKWKIGHTLGASGGLSLEFALLMLAHQCAIGLPYTDSPFIQTKKLNHILINTAGFGGNVISILLSKA